MRRALTSGLAVIVLVPAAARAADPIMPLAEVKPGMRCTGLTVFRGTTVEPFDVEVLDVVESGGPRILFRASGSNIEPSGIGQGFSGSPIRCPSSDGVVKTAGAISEGVGAYGNLTGLATPIEAVLGVPVDAPATAPRLRARTTRLGTPLALSGLTPALGRTLAAAGRRAGRLVIAAPARPRAASPPQTLVPGSAMGIGYATGAIGAGAIGTVAYVDGDRVWGLGHSFEGVGRRSLLLQDAFVHTVIANPVGAPGAATYKLASPGNAIGTLTNDGLTAVAGRMGARPPLIPVRVTGRDLDTGRLRAIATDVADESAIGTPSGTSPLLLVGTVAIGDAAMTVLQGSPARQQMRACVRIEVRERPRDPFRLCNRYFADALIQTSESDFLSSAAQALIADAGAMIAMVDGFAFAPLHIAKLDASVHVRRGLRQSFLTAAAARTAVVRRGSRVAVRLRLRSYRGAARTITVRVRIPRGARRGPGELVLSGRAAEQAEGDLEDVFSEVLSDEALADEESAPTGDPGPRTLRQLERAIEGLERPAGIGARIGRASSRVETASRDELISGRVSVPVFVR